MTWPNIPGETRMSAGRWSLAGSPSIDATLWHVTAPGKHDRFVAEVMQNGQLINTLTGPTKASLVQQLERRYQAST